MYYILYNRQTLKVEHIYTKPLTASVCDNFYEINGIAEYRGEIPKNDWLTVDNIREEIETWKEKELVIKEVKKIIPKTIEKTEPVYNENNEIIDFSTLEQVVEEEITEPVEEEIEVEKSKTHIICDLVAHFYQKRELTKEQRLQKEKERLRKLRETECFIYINRGEMWYKRLTEEQKVELDSWYQAWLDVTETLEIPTKPTWLI